MIWGACAAQWHTVPIPCLAPMAWETRHVKCYLKPQMHIVVMTETCHSTSSWDGITLDSIYHPVWNRERNQTNIYDWTSEAQDSGPEREQTNKVSPLSAPQTVPSPQYREGKYKQNHPHPLPPEWRTQSRVQEGKGS